MPAPRPTLVLGDVETLLTDLSAFMDAAVPDGTTRAYERHWEWWTELCDGLGEDPRDASFAAWREALEVRRPDGRRYSAKRPGQLLAAVRFKTEGERTPAPDLPEHRAEWDELVVGHRRLAAAQGCSCDEDDCACGVTPATRADVNAILSLPYAEMRYRGSNAVHQRRPMNEAAMLVALDTGLSAYDLAQVVPEDVDVLEGGAVRIKGTLVLCDHRPRERGVPWPCGACAVRSIRVEAAAGSRLFGSVDSLTRLFATRRREWHRTLHAQVRGNGTVASQLLLREGLTLRQAAGVRLGLALSCWQNPEGAWLLGRAWFVLAFAAGYRMCGDLARLDRGAVSFAPDGSFVSLTLAATKSDQTASETVVRPFHFGASDDPVWAAECFATYLAVRDALVGHDSQEPLWMSAPPKGARGLGVARTKDPVKLGNRMLADLTRVLGLRRLTTYSARKGYAEEGFASGWEPTRVQAGMRHVFVDTTLRYYREKQPQAAVNKLADARAARLRSQQDEQP